MNKDMYIEALKLIDSKQNAGLTFQEFQEEFDSTLNLKLGVNESPERITFWKNLVTDLPSDTNGHGQLSSPLKRRYYLSTSAKFSLIEYKAIEEARVSSKVAQEASTRAFRVASLTLAATIVSILIASYTYWSTSNSNKPITISTDQINKLDTQNVVDNLEKIVSKQNEILIQLELINTSHNSTKDLIAEFSKKYTTTSNKEDPNQSRSSDSSSSDPLNKASNPIKTTQEHSSLAKDPISLQKIGK